MAVFWCFVHVSNTINTLQNHWSHPWCCWHSTLADRVLRCGLGPPFLIHLDLSLYHLDWFVYQSIYLFMYPSIYLSIHPSIYLTIYLSIQNLVQDLDIFWIFKNCINSAGFDRTLWTLRGLFKVHGHLGTTSYFSEPFRDGSFFPKLFVFV